MSAAVCVHVFADKKPGKNAEREDCGIASTSTASASASGTPFTDTVATVYRDESCSVP
ncbi:hypothetical protein AB0D37_43050 [Streptomyces sp. NPDC048384]|uniref:hypothetical protein n=1 Tax=Streptomyces sp. NPDC048384 TaxID=3155487 RepID=UPI003419E900